MRIAALAVLALLPTLALADTITTRDGAVHEGKVLRELERGYLFREAGGTGLITFDQIADINLAGATRLEPPPNTGPKPCQGISPDVEALLRQRGDLLAERAEISLAWPIFWMVAGTLVGIGGITELNNAYFNQSTAVLTTGLGLGAVTLGSLVLGLRVYDRGRIGNNIAEIDAKLDAIRGRPR